MTKANANTAPSVSNFIERVGEAEAVELATEATKEVAKEVVKFRMR
jgi:hypothetical protein